MNVTQEYPDILQNIEFSIVSIYKEQPELRDPEVIAALEKLVSFYTRQKKNLPALPVKLAPRSLAVFNAMKNICEMRREGSGAETDDGNPFQKVPLRILILCLERLLDSAQNWHKRDGQRGCLQFISNFVG